MAKYNPYYSPESFELELLSFDEPDLSYEYNTLCFWATKDGRVYSTSDSGCSCPTPFEQYDSGTLDELVQQLERVGSVEQAIAIFNSWNCGLPMEDRNKLAEWVKANLKA